MDRIILFYYLLAFCEIFAVESKIISKSKIILEPEVSKAITDGAVSCAKEGDDIQAYLNTISECKYISDIRFKKFVRCLGMASGFYNQDGKLNEKETIALFPEKEKMIEVVRECNKLSGPNELETQFLVFNCYQDNTPYSIELTTKLQQ